MAGITDNPFRKLCLKYGADIAYSEMISSNPSCWSTNKSQLRAISVDEDIKVTQIAGSEPHLLAEAAKYNVDKGSQIIDINMGCPAKKVNKKLSGSALLKDEALVKKILKSVVDSVSIPVTLKIRTGWSLNNKNCVTIAKIAEDSGVQALTVHGRTRECMFKGTIDYESIKKVKEAINIPVIANGDIVSPQKAKYVLDFTGADAIMIGRAAQGNPWIFKEISQYLLNQKEMFSAPSLEEKKKDIIDHLEGLYSLYGDYLGTRIARKHVIWYLIPYEYFKQCKRRFTMLEQPHEQLSFINQFFQKQL